MGKKITLYFVIWHLKLVFVHSCLGCWACSACLQTPEDFINGNHEALGEESIREEGLMLFLSLFSHLVYNSLFTYEIATALYAKYSSVQEDWFFAPLGGSGITYLWLFMHRWRGETSVYPRPPSIPVFFIQRTSLFVLECHTRCVRLCEVPISVCFHCQRKD